MLGINKEFIIWMLKREIEKGKIFGKLDSGWSIDIREYLAAYSQACLINIKPNHSTELFLVELTHVYGFNHKEWTSLLYRFQVLHDAKRSEDFDDRCFDLAFQSKPEIVYSFLYALGHIKEKELKGKWLPPYGTTTALLMWP